MSETPVKWTAAGLTPAGNALQAALLGTGDGLTFTRAAAADAEGVERLDLTLQAPCTVDGPKCRVPVLLTNAGVETGFTMTELRFYVRRVTDGAPTGEEVLYATVTDETGDPIPTAAQSPGFTIDWAFVFQFGNASEVTVTLDPVGLVSIGMVGQPNGVAGLAENGAVPIPQGGTGATTVQSALLNLNAAASTLGQITENDLLAWADKQTISGAFGVNPSVTTAGVPIVGWYHGALEVKESGLRICITESTGSNRTWINCTSEGKWIGWVNLVNATPPKVRNLTLQSGFTPYNSCTFSKIQENVTFLVGGITGTMPANQDTQLGTLPADIRPSGLCRRAATTDVGTAYIEIHTDGTVWAHPFADASQCWFDTAFVAVGGT